MAARPKIAFIGAGSTVFMKNIVGDVLQRTALANAHISLMDIDRGRLEDAELVAKKLVASLGVEAVVSAHGCQREAIDGADFVIVAFQIAGYRPGTVNDFEIPKKYGLRQTIGDTIGIGGIMRGLRTVPHLWSLCDDMMRRCPDATLLQYVNPMAINCWAIAERFPDIRVVGLCHSVQGTAGELARDLDIPIERISYLCAGINHVAFFLRFEEMLADGSRRDLYPRLLSGYADGRIPKPNDSNPRCPNIARYEVMKLLGYFVTESSEHFSEYVPWFIKKGRADLLERYKIPLDEYIMRCEEQIEEWKTQSRKLRETDRIEVSQSREYASDIINSVWTGDPSEIYGNLPNRNLIESLPAGCCVEVPCLVDRNGIQPSAVGKLPPQLTALMRTNINVQELTVGALIGERRDHVYHAALMDPHTAAELDPAQICAMVDELIEAHADWLPGWLNGRGSRQAG